MLLPVLKLIDFKEAVEMTSSHNLLPWFAINPPTIAGPPIQLVASSSIFIVVSKGSHNIAQSSKGKSAKFHAHVLGRV
jgi:hypothetical protein